MTDELLQLGIQALLAATIVGLVATGRWRLAWCFFLYLTVTLTADVLRYFWPERFFTPEFWMAKEATLDVLKLGLVLEIALRTFGGFQGALRRGRRLVLVILASAAAAALAAPSVVMTGSDPVYLAFVGEVHPRAAVAILWLMVALLGGATWYLVPLHPFRAGILASLGAFLAVNVALSALEGLRGWEMQAYFNLVDRLIYFAAGCCWAWFAWAPEGARASAFAETVVRIQRRTA